MALTQLKLVGPQPPPTGPALVHERVRAPAAESSLAPTGTRVLEPARIGDYLDRLYRAAWALCGSRERAEALVQDTCARMLARPTLLRNDDDLSYLLRALRNTFISQQRRARSRPAVAAAEELDRLEHPTSPQPHAAAEARLVFEAIAALPHHFRDALVAVDVVGLRYREAARALCVREATLTTRVFRARQKVVKTLRPEAEPGV